MFLKQPAIFVTLSPEESPLTYLASETCFIKLLDWKCYTCFIKLLDKTPVFPDGRTLFFCLIHAKAPKGAKIQH